MRRAGSRAVLAALAGLALAAQAAAAERPDPFERRIAVGRLAVLIDRAGEVLGGLEGEATGDGDLDTPEAIHAALYDASLDLERLRARACREKRLSGKVCARRFAPSWLSRPVPPRLSLPTLSRWIDSFQAEVLSVTGPICAQVPPEPGGPPACSVE